MKTFTHTYLIKDSCLDYIKNSQNPNSKEKIQKPSLIKKFMKDMDISPERIYTQQMST